MRQGSSRMARRASPGQMDATDGETGQKTACSPPSVSLDHQPGPTLHAWQAKILLSRSPCPCTVPRRLDLPSPAPSSHQSLNAGMPHACWLALGPAANVHLAFVLLPKVQRSLRVSTEIVLRSSQARSHLLALALSLPPN